MNMTVFLNYSVLISNSAYLSHCALKIASSHSKNIDDNFANYFFITKANNKCFIMLKCTKGYRKHKWVRVVKSMAKALQNFKVDPVLKIDETF